MMLMEDGLENCQDPAFRLIFVIQRSEVHKENHNRIRCIKVVACIIYGETPIPPGTRLIETPPEANM
jgi:hypothetical protein